LETLRLGDALAIGFKARDGGQNHRSPKRHRRERPRENDSGKEMVFGLSLGLRVEIWGRQKMEQKKKRKLRLRNTRVTLGTRLAG
jgi:hypothetical protein